jgi:hypothetical protein
MLPRRIGFNERVESGRRHEKTRKDFFASFLIEKESIASSSAFVAAKDCINFVTV